MATNMDYIDHIRTDRKKKPSKITVSDVALVLAILNFLFVVSGIFLK